jgi:hypothetical protein
MTVLLRAIVAASDASRARGADPALVVARAGAIAALASHYDGALTAETPALLEHHRIVDEIFKRAPCLPARFGGVFADARTLGIRLAEREGELALALAKVGQRCELAITLAWKAEGAMIEGSAAVPATGRDYLERGRAQLRALRSRETRAKDVVARLVAELSLEQAFTRHETCPRPAVAASMALLVTRDQIAVMRSRIEEFGATLPDITTTVQGPWPPYTFAVSA